MYCATNAYISPSTYTLTSSVPSSVLSLGGPERPALPFWNNPHRMSNVLADVGGFFVQIGPSLIKAVTNSGSKSDAIQPRAPALDGFIHADVVQARGLLPREPSRGGGAVKPELCGLLQQEGQDSDDDDDDEGEVDPFVQVQVLVSDGAGLVTHHAAGSRTGSRTETSRPVFEEELVLADLEGADGVRSCHVCTLCDKDTR